jgi:hypothetical protein
MSAENPDILATRLIESHSSSSPPSPEFSSFRPAMT